MSDLLPLSTATLLSFALAALLIELTPGPNMTYLALVSANDGRRAGFATVAGIALGLAIIGGIAAFGVAELIQASALLYEGLRWAGSLFLLYLAWEGWVAGTDVVSATGRQEGKYFTRGLVTNLLNPKAALFYIAVVPEFTSGPAPSARELAVLVSVYVAVATFVHGLIVLLAGTLQEFLAAPQRRKLTGNVFAVVLFLVAVWLFASSGR